jgi:uncharacterized protein YndB with AHSA1/START domain
VSGTPSGTRTVEHEVRIDARPETVFAFFTDPARMVRWMGTEATLDPRPGGVCRVGMTRDFAEAVVRGEFVEVVPYSRVVFTWGWEVDLFAVPPASTRVEVSLVPDGGATVVRIAHSELPEVGVAFHEAGWKHYAERLKVVAEGGDPGPDEWMVPVELWPSPPEDGA